MKDQMTHSERMKAALALQECDRVPISPLFHYASAGYLGKTVREYATDAKTLAECSLFVQKEFDFDSVMLGTDVAIEAEALGAEVEQPENSPMHILKPLFHDDTDISSIEVPDVKKAGRLPLLTEAVARCKETVGDKGFVISCANGPMNNAGQFYGVQELMFLIMENPDRFEEVLDFSLQYAIAFSRVQIEAGADMILLGEALASPNFINPELYRDYILPRQKILNDAIHQAGAYSLMHICGHADAILKDMGEAGFDCLDIDYCVPMSKARDESGIACRGNLDPSRAFVQGTAEDVRAAVKAVMEDAKDRKGLIIGSGCDISVITPHENMYAYSQACHEYGWY